MTTPNAGWIALLKRELTRLDYRSGIFTVLLAVSNILALISPTDGFGFWLITVACALAVPFLLWNDEQGSDVWEYLFSLPQPLWIHYIVKFAACWVFCAVLVVTLLLIDISGIDQILYRTRLIPVDEPVRGRFLASLTLENIGGLALVQSALFGMIRFAGLGRFFWRALLLALIFSAGMLLSVILIVAGTDHEIVAKHTVRWMFARPAVATFLLFYFLLAWRLHTRRELLR